MAPPLARTSYSDKDRENLVKYLAVYSDSPDGRKGNKLYQNLVENAEGRWPWSSRHTWQSWRDHYTKNSDALNRSIKNYQKRKGLGPYKVPAQDDAEEDPQPKASKRKASGTAQELHGAKRVKRGENPTANGSPQRSSASKPPRAARPPSPPPTSETESSAAPAHPIAEGKHEKEKQASIPAQPRPKSILKGRKVDDDDPFISSPPGTPTSLAPSQSRKQPPKYQEGAFRSTLNVGKPPTWPPIRNKTKNQNKTPLEPTSSALAMPPPDVPDRVKAAATSSSSSSTSSGPQYVVVNTQASSSKTQLPPGKFKSVDEAIGRNTNTITTTPVFSQSSHAASKKASNPAPIRITPQPQADPVKPKQRPQVPVASLSRGFPVAFESDNDTPLSRGALNGNGVTTKPSRVQKPEELRKADSIEAETPCPRIDLKDFVNTQNRSRRLSSLPSGTTTTAASSISSSRASLPTNTNAKRRRRSSNSFNASSLNAHAPRRSSSAFSAASFRDTQHFEDAGRQLVFAQLGKEYGFDVGVVSNMYERLRDLERTKGALRELREKLREAGKEILDRELGGTNDDDDEDGSEVEGGAAAESDQGSEGGKFSFGIPSARKSPKAEAKVDRRRSSGPRRSLLTMRPIPHAPDPLEAHYSPPRRTRAGRYSRHADAARRQSGLSLSEAGRDVEGLMRRWREGQVGQTPSGMGVGEGSEGRWSSPALPMLDLRESAGRGRPSLPPSSPLRGELEGEDGDDEQAEDEDEEKAEEQVEEQWGEQEEEQWEEHDEERWEGQVEEQVEDDEDDNGSSDEEETQVKSELIDYYDGELYAQSEDEEHEADADPEADVGMALDTDVEEEDVMDDHHAPEPPSEGEDDEEAEAEFEAQSALAEALNNSTDPSAWYKAFSPKARKVHHELFTLATMVNHENIDAMREWEGRQDPEDLQWHQAVLLETFAYRVSKGERHVFDFSGYTRE
ncbi:hypothetical protein D9611_011569 [Ephemerocybe angulata]|uniref:TERF2-interacting telomeric protein 1 Myb domain-containing protein n=1 Tax=Ephemerocybe angulata TaxID=980116 RepID=A0A8H5AUY9_9AGAR|nr:hypothetical protein D9611_011569 [Tulosesus angulatus]